MTERPSEAAALVSKKEKADAALPKPTEAACNSGAASDDVPTSADAEKRAKRVPASTNTTGPRARSTAAGASSVPPIMPQRSILRKPSREYQPPDPVGGMAAHKRYYDYPPPPQGAAYHHPHHRHAQYPGPPAPPMMAMMRPGTGGTGGPGGGGGVGGGGADAYHSSPPPFRPFGYSSGRQPGGQPRAYAQHAAAADPHQGHQGYYGGAAEHYQYHQQYAAAAAAAAAAQYRGRGSREGPSPRIAMGPGRGPLPPWLGGPGGSVSPLRPPPPRAHFKPEAYGRVGRRLALAEEADGDGANTGGPDGEHGVAAIAADGEEEGPAGTTRPAERDSKYDDALLLAEVSKIAETEAHHRKEAEAEANSNSGSSSGGSAASTDGDAAGGIQHHQVNQQEQVQVQVQVQGEAPPAPIKKESYDDADGIASTAASEKASSSSTSASMNTTKEELDRARRRFSDQAKTGSLASPVVRSTKATGNDEEAETGDKNNKARSPPPIQLDHPPASQGQGRRYPPNYEEQYAEYYYPPTSSYPMRHMSLRMQAGQDHRRGNSGELFYSPGGPYPIRAGRYHPQEYEGGDPDGAIDRQERPSRPPPEYTPPVAYFNRHAPRQPSKHVEVTPNSHEESPLSRSKRSHLEIEEDGAATRDGSGGSPEVGNARSTQRRARFDETTERDQEDRDRRRAAAAEAAAKASGGSGAGPRASAIPPFPSPRWGAGVSAGDEKAVDGQTKPYLPPPRPSTGSRFPYQDDQSRLTGEYVPTVTPRGGETSKPVHTFNSTRPAPTPPPQDQQPEGPGWSPYPLHHHRRIPSGGFEFTIRPRDFATPGDSDSGIVSTWGKSASWDNEEGAADQGSPPTPSTPSKAPRTPQKGHRKSLPSVSMDYSDSPPGNAVFTPRSSFDPMAESHRFLPPTPGGFFSDPADYLDYGDYQYAESSGPPSQHQYASSSAVPPPHMMMPRRQQAPHQQAAPFHPGSPQALAPRQFVTPSSSSGSKYPPLSAFQPDGSAGGYYGGGDNYYAGKTIIRRKCPWKNFPELEDFLIANRDEYLRHSAMNYTSQQRQYNNRLTERLLELAARHGYVFDEEDFGEYFPSCPFHSRPFEIRFELPCAILS